MRTILGSLVLAVAVVFGAAATASGADDMWKTLKGAGKTPAQLQAEALVEQEQQAARAKQKPRTPVTGAVMAPGSEPDPYPIDLPDVTKGPMGEMMGCFQSVQTHEMGLIADILEHKLATSRDLSDENRRMIKEDVAALRQAERTKARDMPMRPLGWLTPADEERLAQQRPEYARRISGECQEKYGAGALPNGP